MPNLTETECVLLGAFALLGGAFLHECLVRISGERKSGELLVTLRHLQSRQEEEIATLRAALARLQEGSPIDGKDQRVDAVISEVKVLQSLIEQLSQVKSGSKRQKRTGSTGKKENEPRALSANADDRGLPPSHPLSRGMLDRAAKAMSAAREGKVVPSGEREAAANLPTPMEDDALSEDMILEIAQEALREDRVDLVLQPIVTFPQRRRRYYECYSRLRTREGYSVRPEQYISIAEDAGFVTAIDNMLLFRCVQLLRKIRNKDERLDFFCNISGHTLADGSFFGDFLDFLESDRELAPRLVFEFTQHSVDNWSQEVFQFLDRLKALGCRFSIDQVQTIAFNPEDLVARGIKYVKLPAALVLNQLEPDSDFLWRCRQAGLVVIVEKVESEEVVRELLDYEIDCAQGYLFSEPRLARPAA